MKKILILTAVALTLGVLTTPTQAQDEAPARPEGPRSGERRGGPDDRGPGHRPPLPVLIALDANHDGVIDAAEISNAAAALKALDKNGDGQITRDEMMPPRPEGRGPDEGRGHGHGRPEFDRERPPVE